MNRLRELSLELLARSRNFDRYIRQLREGSPVVSGDSISGMTHRRQLRERNRAGVLRSQPHPGCSRPVLCPECRLVTVSHAWPCNAPMDPCPWNLPPLELNSRIWRCTTLILPLCRLPTPLILSLILLQASLPLARPLLSAMKAMREILKPLWNYQ